jgi:hypothetical protein
MNDTQSDIIAGPSSPDVKLTGASSRDEFPLQFDAILPIQFYEGLHRSRAELDPVRRLMLAILIDAVRCFQNNGVASASRRRNFADAEFWLFRATDGPFSFETVCDTLEIDASRLRQGLLRWQTRKLAGEAAPRMIRRTAVNPRRAPQRAGGVRLHRAKATVQSGQ